MTEALEWWEARLEDCRIIGGPLGLILAIDYFVLGGTFIVLASPFLLAYDWLQEHPA